MSKHVLLQWQSTPTTSGNPVMSQKWPLDTLKTLALSKPIHISTNKDSIATDDKEGEPGPKLDIPCHYHWSDTLDNNNNNNNNKSGSMPETTPLPTVHSQPHNPSASSQGQTAAKPTHPTPTSIAQKATTPIRPSALILPNLITSTSSHDLFAAPKHNFDTTAYLAQHPPPSGVNDVNTLSVWAIQIAKECGQTLDPSSLNSQPQQITQVIARHSSHPIGTNPHQQDPSNCLSQAPTTNQAASCVSTPTSDNMLATHTDSTSNCHKVCCMQSQGFGVILTLVICRKSAHRRPCSAWAASQAALGRLHEQQSHTFLQLCSLMACTKTSRHYEIGPWMLTRQHVHLSCGIASTSCRQRHCSQLWVTLLIIFSMYSPSNPP